MLISLVPKRGQKKKKKKKKKKTLRKIFCFVLFFQAVRKNGILMGKGYYVHEPAKNAGIRG